MKIVFFSPYLPTHSGGGEKHLFDVAQVLSETHSVFIAVSERFLADKTLIEIRSTYEHFYGRSLKKCQFITTPLFTSKSSGEKLLWTAQFDCLYYVTDGSLFFSLAKKNLLHVQVPFTHPLSLLDSLKLLNWQGVNVNSQFTQKTLKRAWPGVATTVLYPVITDATSHKHTKKKKIIGVGRFFTGLHAKRQDILVDAFRFFCEHYPQESKGWELVLIGSCEDAAYLKQVQARAAGLSISFCIGISRADLLQHYAEARFFWHAAGYGIDEDAHPEQVEHFGITTLEAMSYEVIPLVIGKGGQKEILTDELQHLLWSEPEECVQKMCALMQSDQEATLRKKVHARSQDFGEKRFRQQVKAFFGERV